MLLYFWYDFIRNIQHHFNKYCIALGVFLLGEAQNKYLQTLVLACLAAASKITCPSESEIKTNISNSFTKNLKKEYMLNLKLREFKLCKWFEQIAERAKRITVPQQKCKRMNCSEWIMLRRLLVARELFLLSAFYFILRISF